MRKNRNDTGLEAIRIEGGLLSSSLLTLLRHYQLSGQTPEEYGIEKGLKLNDELSRYWRIAQARWQQFSDLKKRADLDHDTVAKENWLIPLFTRVLDFQIEESRPIHVGERTFPITHTAFKGSVPFVLTGPERSLEKGDPQFGEEGRKRSAAGLLQEYINAKDCCLWAIVSNGLTLRLLRDNPAMARPAYIEIDLERLFEEELYVDFTVFWLLLHASRLQPRDNSPENCILEQWRNQGQVDGERVLGELRHGVTNALRIMGTGFVAHPKNLELREAIKNEQLTTDQFFQELLRLIYRFLFLLTTEDRDILLDPVVDNVCKKIYREGYSISLLRDRSRFRRHYDNYGDGWQQLCITFAGFATGQPQLAQPALGGLFSADQCPQLEQAQLANRYLYDALFKLCYFESKGVLTRINYKDMDTEELGSVYESLLELIPQLNINGQWHFGFLGDEADDENATGHARKLTGSYYTPDSLVQELIKSTLEPVIEDRLEKDKSKPREVLLGISVCDPACGSGHFLLAAARRLAAELARIEAGTDQPTEAHYRHALREVVSHCIYGVDLNPLAVELCRTALWLETIEPGKPLGFLDAHIRHGNSLVGLLGTGILSEGIPDEAYKPLAGDEKEIAAELKKENIRAAKGKQMLLFDQNGVATLSACALDLDAMPEENLEQVQQKSEAWLRIRLSDDCRREHLKAHLFTAAFFASKTQNTKSEVPTSADLARISQGMQLPLQLTRNLDVLAAEHGFFHWHLAFPEVFAEAKEGFDVLLGNPPWERIKLQEQEFFAARSPEIAKAPNAAARSKLINRLTQKDASATEKALYREFVQAKHSAEAASLFARNSGRFPLTGKGDVNLYALFSEHFLQCLNKEGRAGFIVPTGIATDDSTSEYFEAVLSRKSLVSLYDFENRLHIFAALHTKTKFCLIILSGQQVEDVNLCFMATAIADLSDQNKAFRMTATQLAHFNPTTKTTPIFRSRRDAQLALKIYERCPIFVQFGEKGQDNWNVTFGTLFHMSNDSGMFMDNNENGLFPLYEAKMFWHFDHRWASFNGKSIHLLHDNRKNDPRCKVEPRYWVPISDLKKKLDSRKWGKQWLLVFRNVSDSRNERTFVTSIIPLCGLGHSASAIFVEVENVKLVSCLLACLNSILLDYVARQKIPGMNISYFMLKQLPVLPPEYYSQTDIAFISSRVLELTYTSDDIKSWAEDLGFYGQPYNFDPKRRAKLRAELDAYYARLYGLTRDELRYILDPADVMGEEYPSETFRVLKEREINEFGEYRTQRLVLEAWDELSAAETIKKTAPVAEFSLYPETDSDRAICAIALAFVQQTGGMCSMDHLDALILAVRPELCRIFLSKSDQHSLDTAIASAPKILWSDNRLNIHWKECRDHLEARKAIYIRHGLKDQPIEVGSEFSTVQASFPRHVEKIAIIALNALAKVNELRKSRAAVTSEQAKSLSIFENQHRAYQLVA